MRSFRRFGVGQNGDIATKAPFGSETAISDNYGASMPKSRTTTETTKQPISIAQPPFQSNAISRLKRKPIRITPHGKATSRNVSRPKWLTACKASQDCYTYGRLKRAYARCARKS